MNNKDFNQKLKELEIMVTREVIIREDIKTKEPYLSGHCVCPNTWHRVKIVDGKPFFGCSVCGCSAVFINGKWITGYMSPNGFISDKELQELKELKGEKHGKT